MSEFFDVGMWLEWFSQLDRTFVFLLLLPFVVAMVGLWAAWRDREIGYDRDEEEGEIEHAPRPSHRARVGNHRYN